MKIALVGRGFSTSWGGAERFGLTLARALEEAGHCVEVYAGRVEGGGASGFTINRVPVVTVSSALRLLSFNRNVRRMLDKGDHDVVLGLCQFFPLDIYRAGGGVYAHWMRLRYANPLVRAAKYVTSPVHIAMRWLEKKIMEPGNHRFVVANSRLVKEHLKEDFDLDDSDIRVIYNGIDHALFNPGARSHRDKVRKRLGVGKNDLLLLFVSNNWKRKGLGTIIRALAPGGGFRAVVVGRGRQRGFSRAIEASGLDEGRVIFAGTTDRVEEFYGAADAFVLPTQYDPCSNACLEAMACALPVITTDTNGASEFIEHGKNGFVLHDWADHEALRGFLHELEVRERRELMGRRAHEAVRGLTVERTMREFVEVCEAAIELGGGRSAHAGVAEHSGLETGR